jgi:hypothetical protein
MNRIVHSMKARRGGVMMVVLLLAAVITVAGAYTLRTVLYQAQAADHSYHYQQALAVAEAGLESALWEFNHTTGDTRWSGWESTEDGYSTSQSVTGPDGSAIGQFQVVVYDSETLAPVIESTGFIPDTANPDAKRRLRVVALRQREPSFFDWGIFAYGNQRFAGGFDISSYDSIEGDYSTSPNQNHTYGNIGGLGSAFFENGTDVFGSVEVAGSITSPRKLVHGANVDGQNNAVLPFSNPTEPPPFPEDDFQDVKAVNDNNTGLIAPVGRNILEFYDPALKTLTINENNLTIKMRPGNYYFTKISLNGNSSAILVEPQGEVRIYLEGQPATNNVFYVNNTADMNANGRARDFKIFIKSGQVYWENAGIIHAAIFAPNSDITVDNAFEMGGSMTGRNISVDGGGYFVYDEDLGRPGFTNDGAVVAAWNEIKAE